LVDGAGDCEDTSFLLTALFKAYLNEYYKNENIPEDEQIKVAIFEYPDHIAVGIGYPNELYENDMEICYQNGNHCYYYIETTSEDFFFGEIPEEYQNIEPIIYIVN
jgi:hypothetical protein